MIRRRRNLAPGATLLELTFTLVVMAILMGAMTSAVLVASRAAPPASDPVVAALAAGTELDTLADDLRYATAFAVLQPNAVQFTVPDRTQDAAPEEIRYEWSGTPGDPLRRRVNGGAWSIVVPKVGTLALSYNTKPVNTTSTVTTTVTSPEVQFAYFNGWPGVSPTYSSLAVGPTTYGGEYFLIDQGLFPADAQNIKVSRVQLLFQKTLVLGSVSVGIHPVAAAGSPVPAASPLGSTASVSYLSLPASFAWVDVALPSDVVIPDASAGYVIVVKGSLLNTANWRMYSSSSAPKDAAPTAIWTTDGGGSWQPNKSSQFRNDFPFYVYGTYESQTTQEVTTTTYFLRSVGVTLRVAGSSGPPIATAVQVYAQPQVTP